MNNMRVKLVVKVFKYRCLSLFWHDYTIIIVEMPGSLRCVELD